MEPQLRDAAAQDPAGRSGPEIAQDLMDELKQRGLAPSWLQKMLGLGTADPSQASPDDVAKLAEYSRQNHPEVFQRVMADKPFLVRWMSKPLVAALVGRDRRQAAEPGLRQVIQPLGRTYFPEGVASSCG